jgi:hypothetical protein
MSADAWIGVFSSVLCAMVGYGVQREKVRRLEEDVKSLETDLKESEKDFEEQIRDVKRDREQYVTFKHFDAVILPLRTTLDNVQVDIKVLLKMVSEKEHH